MPTKVDAKRLLSQENVDSSPRADPPVPGDFQINQVEETTRLTNTRFELYNCHKLARDFIPFFEHAGKERRERLTRAVESLAVNFARLLEPASPTQGGGSNDKLKWS